MLPLDDFIAHVAASGLITPEVLSRVRSQIDPEPAGDVSVRLARRLIENGWLTSYQAKKLLGGATRGFFLGGYRLMRPIGEGGMGKVYLAIDDRREQVAIKVLPPRKAAEEDMALRRFRREMDLSQRCSHPNLARTIAVGSEGDVHFMVMEYIPGKSLFDLVKNEGVGPLRVPDAAKLFLKVVDGLEAAHHSGLIHRDIKPSNIMITPLGEAKLLDLGLARALGDETGLTRVNTVLGTLDYASPEQLRDATKADIRSDLYSLGCTLYFALSGGAPFEGGDMINKIYKQRMEDPPPLEGRARGVPAAFAAVVRKLMSKNPDEQQYVTSGSRLFQLRIAHRPAPAAPRWWSSLGRVAHDDARSGLSSPRRHRPSRSPDKFAPGRCHRPAARQRPICRNAPRPAPAWSRDRSFRRSPVIGRPLHRRHPGQHALAQHLGALAPRHQAVAGILVGLHE